MPQGSYGVPSCEYAVRVKTQTAHLFLCTAQCARRAFDITRVKDWICTVFLGAGGMTTSLPECAEKDVTFIISVQFS